MFVLPHRRWLDSGGTVRTNGIDAWVDKWEILPGDSLVQKIFDEGLKNAASVVVILSQFSVTKPWVREELDGAVVNRINQGSKLIPIVLDDCDVPQVLQATVWERVQDVNDVAGVVDRVVAAVFEHRQKPPLGAPPVYVAPTYSALPGLSDTDTFVLEISAKWTIDTDDVIVDPVARFLSGNAPVISKALLIDSIDMLDEHGYIKAHRHLGPGPCSFRVTDHGLEVYLSNRFPEYDSKIREVIALIVNKDIHASDALATAAAIPRAVARHIVSQLEGRGFLRVSRTLGGPDNIYSVSASLKRVLADLGTRPLSPFDTQSK